MLSRFTQIGVKHAKSNQESRAYYHSNIINLTVIGLFSARFILDILFYDKSLWVEKDIAILYWTHTAIISSCLIVIFFNFKGWINISRVASMVLVPLIVLILIPSVLANDSLFFWYPYTTIGVSIITYFLFDIKKEKNVIVIIVSFYALFTYFSIEVLEYLLGAFPIEKYVYERQAVYRTNPLLLYGFINTIIYYAFKQNRNNEDLLIETKNELEKSNASKDKFFSILSHDLKGSFSSIIGLAQMMNEKFDSTSKEELKPFVDVLYNSSNNTQKLLQSLLEWSRTQTGSIRFKPVLTDLNQLIYKSIEILSDKALNKKIRINYLNNQELNYRGDPDMLKTIFRNLISNSIKFTPKEGLINIHLEQNQDCILIKIQDSGIGMEEKIISKLFKVEEKISEPGTNNEKGSGLGLLLVKEFVTLHKGSIQVNSKINSGSTFTISLPKNI